MSQPIRLLQTLRSITQPARLDLIALPPNQQLITLSSEVGENLFHLRSYTPIGWAEDVTVVRNRTGNPVSSREQFMDENCDGCDYNFTTRSENSTDEDGNSTTILTTSRCPLQRMGWDFTFDHYQQEVDSREIDECYGGTDIDELFACRSGSDQASHHALPPMGFKGVYRWRNNRITLVSTAAAAIRVDQINGRWHVGDAFSALNVHGAWDSICWGSYNEPPSEFSTIPQAYGGGLFNEDLLTVESSDNNHRRLSGRFGALATRPLPDQDIVISTADGPADALIIATEQSHPEAYAQLLMTGVPLKFDGWIACPVVAHELTHNGVLLRGFITPVLPSIGRSWFIMANPDNPWCGLLLDQLTPEPEAPEPEAAEPVAPEPELVPSLP